MKHALPYAALLLGAEPLDFPRGALPHALVKAVKPLCEPANSVSSPSSLILKAPVSVIASNLRSGWSCASVELEACTQLPETAPCVYHAWWTACVAVSTAVATPAGGYAPDARAIAPFPRHLVGPSRM